MIEFKLQSLTITLKTPKKMKSEKKTRIQKKETRIHIVQPNLLIVIITFLRDYNGSIEVTNDNNNIGDCQNHYTIMSINTYNHDDINSFNYI